MLVSFVLLLLTGLIILFAASYYNAQDKGNALSEVHSQLVGIAAGVVGMTVAMRLDYRILAKPVVTGALLLISVILLILVAIPGIGRYINGSRRWLVVGPVSIQPSEIAKYAAIVFMARALSGGMRDIRRLTGLIPLFVVPGVMFLLILMQPNLSTAGSIVIVSVVMVMLAGARWRHLGLLGVCGLGVGTFYALSADYRRARLMSFTHPFDFMTNEGYQLSQSLMAFASGGLFGLGLGKGRQKYSFLPYPESDFIFAIVGADLGFAGCCLILGRFAAFVLFGLRVAIRCRNRFGSMLAGGITCMIGVQAVMNVMVVTGLMPTTGLPLPFFSAGGTSVSIAMTAVALILNISRSDDGL